MYFCCNLSFNKFRMITKRWSNKRPLWSKVWSIWKKHFFSYKTFATIKLTEWWQAVVKVTSSRYQGCGIGGKISDTDSDLSKISDSDSRLHLPTPTTWGNGNEIWPLNKWKKGVLSHGCRKVKRRAKTPYFWRKFQQKSCFLDFKREKQNFTTFGPTWKNFAKIL